MTKAPIKLSDLFRYYKALPHQMAAISELEAELFKVAPDTFNKDQPWFKTWSQDGKHQNLDEAFRLIQIFENCLLNAYKCPAGVWTIGWGNTRYQDGTPVRQGDSISRIKADILLRYEVDRITEKLRATIPFWIELADDQKCALISFAYNLGSNFYGAPGFETITKRLKDKDWSNVPDALLLYRNPGTNVEAGLKERRIAEGKLWTNALQQSQINFHKAKPSDSFSTKLSAHFTLGEFALGQPARRFVAQHQVDTAVELAEFLERVRTAFGGKRITITSGYRPAAINRQVGGASGSEHLFNAPSVGAVDFYVDGADINKVQAWCDKEWPYSLGYGAPKGFVHLGIRGKGRPRIRWDY